MSSVGLALCFEHLARVRYSEAWCGTSIAPPFCILMSITHPTMLARYNLRGQEASDDSGAFFLLLKDISKVCGTSADETLLFEALYSYCVTSTEVGAY